MNIIYWRPTICLAVYNLTSFSQQRCKVGIVATWYRRGNWGSERWRSLLASFVAGIGFWTSLTLESMTPATVLHWLPPRSLHFLITLSCEKSRSPGWVARWDRSSFQYARVVGFIPSQGAHKNQPVNVSIDGTTNQSLSLFPSQVNFVSGKKVIWYHVQSQNKEFFHE